MACARIISVSTATFIVALAAAPAASTIGGKEFLEVYATTPAKEPLNLLVRTAAVSNPAKGLIGKQAGERLIVSGDLTLSLDGDTPELYARVVCDASPEQYLNEVTIVGRVANEAKVTESAKSCSRSVAVNRYSANKEITDWFIVRGYGHAMERISQTPKGSLVSVSGCLEQRTNREGNPYCELKVRQFQVHNRTKGQANPAAGTSAQGYAHEDFTGAIDAMPLDWNT